MKLRPPPVTRRTLLKGLLMAGVALAPVTAAVSAGIVSMSGPRLHVAPTDGIPWSVWADAPATGETAVIPSGTTILMDVVMTDSMGHLAIEPGGVLRMDGAANTRLMVESIDLQGSIKCGYVTGPFIGNARITLTGAPAETNDGVSRGIMTSGMVWELHLWGNPPAVEQIELAANASAGATSLTVLSAPGWKAGDEIVVGVSEFAEVGAPESFTLGSDTSGTTVTLPSPLARPKWGAMQYLVEGSQTTWDNAVSTALSLTNDGFTPATGSSSAPTTVNERSLLINKTRNIVIEGLDDTSFQDDDHGYHLMMMGRRTGAVRLHGVEFRYGGQAGTLGRYPIHRHMGSFDPPTGDFLGDVDDLITYCSVHKSKQNAYVIHGTCGATLQHNVGFDVHGHIYMLEDGVERRNKFQFCAGMFTKAAITGKAVANHTKSPADQGFPGTLGAGPTIFWLTNPDNEVTDCHGSYAAGSGAWLSFGTTIFNASQNVTASPRNTMLGIWARNNFHSNFGMGAVLRWGMTDAAGTADDPFHYGPTANELPTLDVNEILRFDLPTMRLWKNGQGGWHGVTVYEHFVNWAVHSNMGMTLSGVASTFALESVAESSIFGGYTRNNAYLCPPSFDSFPAPFRAPRGDASYHDGLRFRSNTYFNFPETHDWNLGETGYPLSRNAHGGMHVLSDLYEDGVRVQNQYSSNNKKVNAYPGTYTLPPDLEDVDHTNQGYVSLAQLRHDPHHDFGPYDWNGYNIPYITHNATYVQAAGNDAKVGVSIDRGGFGLRFNSDTFAAAAYEARLRATRYDDATTANPAGETPVGVYQISASASGQTFGTKRVLSIPNNSIVVIDTPDIADPTTLNLEFQALTMSSQKAKVGFKMDASAATFIRYQDPDSGLRTYSSVGSWAAFLAATGDVYWWDAANNTFWWNLTGSGSTLHTNHAPAAVS